MEDSGHSQMEACRLKIESWRVCMPMVSDMHNSVDKQNPDPDPHPSVSKVGSGSSSSE